jgi:hypothetical protein
VHLCENPKKKISNFARDSVFSPTEHICLNLEISQMEPRSPSQLSLQRALEYELMHQTSFFKPQLLLKFIYAVGQILKFN